MFETVVYIDDLSELKDAVAKSMESFKATYTELKIKSSVFMPTKIQVDIKFNYNK
jgi:hypothetical protein